MEHGEGSSEETRSTTAPGRSGQVRGAGPVGPGLATPSAATAEIGWPRRPVTYRSIRNTWLACGNGRSSGAGRTWMVRVRSRTGSRGPRCASPKPATTSSRRAWPGPHRTRARPRCLLGTQHLGHPPHQLAGDQLAGDRQQMLVCSPQRSSVWMNARPFQLLLRPEYVDLPFPARRSRLPKWTRRGSSPTPPMAARSRSPSGATRLAIPSSPCTEHPAAG